MKVNKLSLFERLLSWIVGLSRVKYVGFVVFMGLVWLFIQGSLSLIVELVRDGFGRYTYVDAFGDVLFNYLSGTALISIVLISLVVSVIGRGIYRYRGHRGYRVFSLFIVSLVLFIVAPSVLGMLWGSDMVLAISWVMFILVGFVSFVFLLTLYFERSEVGDYDHVLRIRDVFKLVFVVTTLYSAFGVLNDGLNVEFSHLVFSLYLEYIYVFVVLYVVYRWRNVVVRVSVGNEQVNDFVDAESFSKEDGTDVGVDIESGVMIEVDVDIESDK